MHPALSVIFFTVISGAGYGLWFLLGLTLALFPHLFGRNEVLAALALGALFTTAGLASSLLHLGQPLRAWRALSQWRSSWLSREGVAAIATFLPAALVAWLIWRGANGNALRVAGVLLGLLATVTVCCTARIYTCLKTIRAWHNAYVLPAYLLFAALGGMAWLAAIAAWCGTIAASTPGWLALATAGLGASAAVLKRGYWLFVDAGAATSTPASATGLGRFGAVRSVEAPHTEENYLTREMGFVLARKHAARLRVIALVLFACVPLLAAASALPVAWGKSPAPSAILLSLAAFSVIAGTFVERWLFFAEAKHVVMLYYGEARAQPA